MLVNERKQLVNMIRGLLTEFGVDTPRGLDRALVTARQLASAAKRSFFYRTSCSKALICLN